MAAAQACALNSGGSSSGPAAETFPAAQASPAGFARERTALVRGWPATPSLLPPHHPSDPLRQVPPDARLIGYCPAIGASTARVRTNPGEQSRGLEALLRPPAYRQLVFLARQPWSQRST
jgi:hypothetical protein